MYQGPLPALVLKWSEVNITNINYFNAEQVSILQPPVGGGSGFNSGKEHMSAVPSKLRIGNATSQNCN